jgi:hypothetical protein
VREAERLYLAAGQAEIDARHEERDGDGDGGGGGGGYMDGMDLPPMDSESDEYEDDDDDGDNDGDDASDRDSGEEESEEGAAVSAIGDESLELDKLQLKST